MKALVWFTDNLRVADHPLLSMACRDSERVEAVYCFDPKSLEEDVLQQPKMGPYRAKFLMETLAELQEQLHNLHIPFHILVGPAKQVLTRFIRQRNDTHLYVQKVWHSEETRQVQSVLSPLDSSVTVLRAYDQFLIDPDQLPYALDRLPKVFTPFRKDIERQVMVREPLAIPEKRPLDHFVHTGHVDPQFTSIDKTLRSKATDKRTAFPFKGGETQALKRLHDYFWGTDAVATYKETRNEMIGSNYSTKFSAWLANGSISPKTIYAALKQYESECIANQSTYWVFFELLWRDFFKYIGLKHQNKIFAHGGILNKTFAQGRDPEVFNKWITGQTPDQFVNAHMIELAKTGWMSNRGRQNVASYWAKTLGQDWRSGAAYFESALIDYDVDANWGNWMYTSGVGNDPRDRVFNTSRQADMYDPDGAFRQLWLTDQ